MSHALNAGTMHAPARSWSTQVAHPAYQGYLVLHIGFTVLPVIAGLDKFFHLLVNWEMYLAPLATQLIPVSAETFCYAVGVIEVIAGLIVAVRPQIGAYIVMLWLWGIIANLLMTTAGFYDIALRDFGLSLAAIALARLSAEFDSKPLGV